MLHRIGSNAVTPYGQGRPAETLVGAEGFERQACPESEAWDTGRYQKGHPGGDAERLIRPLHLS